MESSAQDVPVEKVPALGISVSVNVSQRVAITLQTFVDRDCDVSVFNAMVDKVTGGADRLVARYDAVDLKKQLSENEVMLERLQTELIRVDQRHKDAWKASGNRGEMKLTNADKEHRSKVTQNIDSVKDVVIPTLKRRIQDLENTAK